MQAPDFTLEEFDLEVATARGMVERSLNRYAAAEAKKNAKLAKTEPATPQSNTAVPVDSAIAVLVEAVSDAAGELATEEPQVVPTRLSKATKTAK